MTMTKTMLFAALACTLATGAIAKTKGPSLRDRQQAACYGDVQRLCADAMPDVNKVTACMKPKKAMVSAPCRALWDVK